MYHQKNNQGFTLIEILISVSIIVIISTLAMIATSKVKQDARDTVCEANLSSISDAIEVRRMTYDKLLKDITGSDCSRCPCSPYDKDSLHDINCVTSLNSAYNSIGFKEYLIDPWGDPFLIDENEGEDPGDPCVYDIIYSVNCGSVDVDFYLCDE